MAGCRCGWLLTYTAALSKDSRHHAASTSTGFASDFRRTRRHPNQPRNFSALRRYVGRIRSSLQSRSQPIHKLLRPAAFVQRTGKTTFAGLRSVRLRGKRSRLWWRWEDSNLRAPCVLPCHSHMAVPAGSCRTQLPLCHISMRGVLVFPSRQIFSVPRFCQQITGAITTSRLEGLTSGLRITQTAIPLKHTTLAVSTLNWCRRLDSNQRHTSWRGALPTELRLRSSPARTAREIPGSLQRIDRHSSCLRGGAYKNLKGLLRRWGGGVPFGNFKYAPRVKGISESF